MQSLSLLAAAWLSGDFINRPYFVPSDVSNISNIQSYLWFQSDLSNIFLTHLKNVGSIPPLLGAFSSFILSLTWFAWRTKYDTHIDERLNEDLNRSISFKSKGQWKLVKRQHHLFSILVPHIDAIVASIVVGKMSGKKNENYNSNRCIGFNMISFNP